MSKRPDRVRTDKKTRRALAQRLFVEQMEPRQLLSVVKFTVNSTGDTGGMPDMNNKGTLRQAIDGVNALTGGDTGEIDFAIAAGPFTITPGAANPLPALTNQVFIDGYSQTGASRNSNAIGAADNAVILIALSGTNLGSSDSLLEFDAGGAGSTLRGLAIGGGAQTNGVYLNATSNVVVVGNFLGTNAAGTAANPNAEGVLIKGGSNNTIGAVAGASTAPDLNVISGNSDAGIDLMATTGNRITGNYIGTAATGTSGLANQKDGVALHGTSTNNTIGGAGPLGRNVVSGNDADAGGTSSHGLFLADASVANNLISHNYVGTNAAGTGAVPDTQGIVAEGPGNTLSGNVVAGISQFGIGFFTAGVTSGLVIGNFIGTDPTGTTKIANGADGIALFQGANHVTIGGLATTTGASPGNVISGSTPGVNIHDTGTTANVVLGNLIGTDSSGTSALGNSTGIFMTASGNTVGGTVSGSRNVISGNTGAGVALVTNGTVPSNNVILGNYIGTDISGASLVPNSTGVVLSGGANGNLIGGSVSGAGNVISGNDNAGISISGSMTTGNAIQGNRIGTDVAGTSAIRNGLAGVSLDGDASNTIGGTASGSRNVISGNNGVGVSIFGGAAGDVVLGNYIGLDTNGTSALPNSTNGVVLATGATSNTIGGTATGSANVISGQADAGIDVESSSNEIAGNFLGTNAAGDAAVPNGTFGILVNATGTTIGGSATGSGNVISGNGIHGIDIKAASTLVQGNRIGTNAAGTAAVFNGTGMTGSGILIEATGATIGGSASGAGNLISGNLSEGIDIEAASALVLGNSIGTNAAGTGGIANGDNGILVAADGNTIGGSVAGAGNVLSGNTKYGINVQAGSQVILGNLVGTNATATAAVGNHDGIRIDGASTANTIGGAGAAGNTISGNGDHGLDLFTSSNLVVGNKIGLLDTAHPTLGNGGFGIDVQGSSNTIGAAGVGNTINGNATDGTYIQGSSNLVQANYYGTDGSGSSGLGNGGAGVDINTGSNNTIGGSTAATRNVIASGGLAGIRLENGSNLVVGNLIGLDPSGTTALPNGDQGGIDIETASVGNTIGGTVSGLSNTISGNSTFGIVVQSSSNLIQGNLIGSNGSKGAGLGNLVSGIVIGLGTGNTIGGTVAAAANVIVANQLGGIQVATGPNLVAGNLIGLFADGTVLGNTGFSNQGNGVSVGGVTGVTIGGASAAFANTIAGNTAAGVRDPNSSTGLVVESNSIFSNGGLGIDLGSAGVTPNGTAGITNYPVFQAFWNPTTSLAAFSGTFIGSPNTSYTLQFFSDPSPDGSGHGEGKTLLASQTVMTDGSGQAVFLITESANPITIGTVVSATATEPTLGTSEFALNSTTADLRYTVLSTADTATPGTLRTALINANASGTAQTILFAIPDLDGTPKVIQLTSALPAITQKIDLNGYSESGASANTNPLNQADNAVLKVVLDGSNLASTNQYGLQFATGGIGSTIRGLAIVGFGTTGSAAIELDSDATGTHSLITGVFLGLNPDGTTTNAANTTGVLDNANGVVIGGTTLADRVVVSNNTGVGLILNGSGGLVQGAFLGLSVDGTTTHGNPIGVMVSGDSATIGGTAAGSGNLFAGATTEGLNLASNGDLVEGNSFGFDAAGTSSLPNQIAVLVSAGTASSIGATVAGAGNVIANSGGDGIKLTSASTPGTLILSNSIFANGGLGIDNKALTPPVPSITSAYHFSDKSILEGTLQGAASTSYIVQYFDNASGVSGQGKTLLGTEVLTTDATGSATISATVGAIALGDVVTATASETTNGTSNFSTAAVVVDALKVTSNADSGAGSLRQAIVNANRDTAPNTTITFGPGPFAIQPTTPLPTLTHPVLIDGFSDGTSSQNTADTSHASNASIDIFLDGALEAGGSKVGLDFGPGAVGSTVRGLAIGDFASAGILVDPSGGSITIAGDYLGTDASGNVAKANGVGVSVSAGATGVTIGGSSPASRVVIAGNSGAGIVLAGASDVVEGDFLGLGANGSALGNGGDGVSISGASNTIGGTSAALRDVISGNLGNGISISGSPAQFNVIVGDYIGTGLLGTSAVPNAFSGVNVASGATLNTIGGVISLGFGDVIAGNTGAGVTFQGMGTSSNLLAGSFIGTNSTGGVALANSGGGVKVFNLDSGETIGGSKASGLGNVISGNAGSGILIDPTSGDVIQGNLIGLAADGTTPLNNAVNGIYVLDSTSITIGGSAATGNVISANGAAGVRVEGSGAIVIAGNLIGTDKTGLVARGNVAGGVVVLDDVANVGSSAITIGPDNVISGNSDEGVLIQGPFTTGVTVSGNTIGLASDGSTLLGNVQGATRNGEGLDLINTSGNLIGGSSGNVISGNNGDGIAFSANAKQNLVQGNTIGLDSTGTAARPNGGDGVDVLSGDGNTIGGLSAAFRNVISGNSKDGLGLFTSNDLVIGNYLGTTGAGTAALGNGRSGVVVGGNNNTVGGSTTAGAGNVISGNQGSGVAVTSTGVVVAGNFIGLSASGASKLGNTLDGVTVASGASATIGGSTADLANHVGGNARDGIRLTGTTNILVQSNLVGTDASDSASLGNTAIGINLTAGSTGNTISGNTIGHSGTSGVLVSGDQNLISGGRIDHSGGFGVSIPGGSNTVSGLTSTNNQGGVLIQGSSNLVASSALTNNSTGGGAGVSISGGSANTIGGALGSTGDTITGNADGVLVGSAMNLIVGNTIRLNTASGVHVTAAGVTVGGTTSSAANQIGSNSVDGVRIDAATGAVVVGNFLGVKSDGTTADGNTGAGISVVSGGSNNFVGGAATGSGNIIAHNGGPGVSLGGGLNLVAGNSITANATGGVLVAAGTGNTIGGTVATASNLISGNTGVGVEVDAAGTLVIGDLVGTSLDGKTAFPNTGDGVKITAGSATIGGTSGAGDTISGNSGAGVHVVGTSGALIAGNLIGVSGSGNAALGNALGGVIVDGSTGVTIGVGNVIAGNAVVGVAFLNSANNGLVTGNTIGLGSDGSTLLGQPIGVRLDASSGVSVGGLTALTRNLISGNATGVSVSGTTVNDLVFGNYLGTNSTGLAGKANTTADLAIASGSSGTTVGGTAAGSGNLVDSSAVGLSIAGSSNVAIGNSIGLGADGSTALGNSQGIVISGASNTIGSAGASSFNVIVNSSSQGVQITGGSATSNIVSGNLIGLLFNGTAAANATGVQISGGASGNTVGGASAGTGNTISRNTGNAVLISGASANLVAGNLVGLGTSGTTLAANGSDAIVLSAATNNTIGGPSSGFANVVAGNGTHDGILLTGAGTSGNSVQSNLVGANNTGTVAFGFASAIAANSSAASNTIGGAGAGNRVLGSAGPGVLITNASTILVAGNTIGGAGSLANGSGVSISGASTGTTIGGSAGNLIAGNSGDGLIVSGGSVMTTAVSGNTIGGSLSNGGNGVHLTGAPVGVTIGGASTASLNVISGNLGYGVEVDGGSLYVIAFNAIGVDSTGSKAQGNALGGLYLNQASNVLVGPGNVISGNTGDGVFLQGGSANVVRGNLIGLTSDGKNAVGNSAAGVEVADSSNNTIGGASGSTNFIAGNVAGISIHKTQSVATGNVVVANQLGTDQQGITPFPNTGDGIVVTGATGTTIGGVGTLRNLIQNSGGAGVHFVGGATGTILGNLIGTNQSNFSTFGNTLQGVLIDGNSPTGIGVVGNSISGNGADGIKVQGASGVSISSNVIGLDVSFSAALHNGGDGVYLLDSTGTFVGGSGLGNTISGNSGSGVHVKGATSSAASNVIAGNRIGLNGAGGIAVANAMSGVFVESATGTTIGGSAAGTGNLISGNTLYGVQLSLGGGTTVLSNTIGANAAANGSVANSIGVGILDSSNNAIGAIGSPNVIAGNTGDGVLIVHDASGSATANVIAGNRIGTILSGLSALPNGGNGVSLVGTDASDASSDVVTGNLISGNGGDGLKFASLSGVAVTANTIGADATGLQKIPNGSSVTEGVLLNTTTMVTIGGSTTDLSNQISGNAGIGVHVTGGGSNVIAGNVIGLGFGGSVALANGGDGVKIDSSPANTIGGTALAAANAISGNSGAGIDVLTSSGTIILGNRIGTSSAGSSAVPNGGDGVLLTSTSLTVIGNSSAGNLISGGKAYGIHDVSGSGTTIAHNTIGTDLLGTTPLGNTLSGVYLQNTTSDVVGGASGLGNLISGNGGAGISISGSAGNGLNSVLGNTIGLGATGLALPNVHGVAISGSPSNTISSGNIIGGNSQDGVIVTGASAMGTVIVGNQFGLNSAGLAVGNVAAGVEIASPGATIGGSAAGLGNTVGGNAVGIQLDAASGGAVVLGNFVGTDSAGGSARPNTVAGIVVRTTSGGATIGGSGLARNLVSGNTGYGIELDAASSVLVLDNLVGTNLAETTALANGSDGLFAQNSSASTIRGNLVSANGADGIHLLNSTNVLIAGNLVGTNASGSAALGNKLSGIEVSGGSSVTVGGTAVADSNLISGNAVGAGMSLTGGLLISKASGVLVEGNKVGTNLAGTVAVANSNYGVVLFDATNATVGGTTTLGSNLISGNAGPGVYVYGDAANMSVGDLVAGNLIGLSSSNTALANQGDGLQILNGSQITVGGAAVGAGNVISGNAGSGVAILPNSFTIAQGSLLLGNRIGTDTTGTTAVANGGSGVSVHNSSNTTIGGSVAGNLISGNAADGILIFNDSSGFSNSNVVLGNRIGTDLTGASALGNGGSGVSLSGGANGTTIGGSAGNVISGNAVDGIGVQGGALILVANNLIGTDATGTAMLGNGVNGVAFSQTSTSTIRGNTIAGSKGLTPPSGSRPGPVTASICSG